MKLKIQQLFTLNRRSNRCLFTQIEISMNSTETTQDALSLNQIFRINKDDVFLLGLARLQWYSRREQKEIILSTYRPTFNYTVVVDEI